MVHRYISNAIPRRGQVPALILSLGAASTVLAMCAVAALSSPGPWEWGSPQEGAETAVLPLVAVAAALMVAIRLVIGVPTLGTFAPVLLSISFVISGLAWGLLTVVVIIAGGFLLEPRLRIAKMPRVARLGILVAFGTSVLLLLDHSAFASPTNAVQLPLVAMVMLTERLWEQYVVDGRRGALRSAAYTVLVACAAVPVLNGAVVTAMANQFPLVLSAAAGLCTWLAGSYRGLRLMELRRFAPVASDGGLE